METHIFDECCQQVSEKDIKIIILIIYREPCGPQIVPFNPLACQ
jgi:hypothetical protein